MLMPSTLAIITNIFSDGAERQRAIGLWVSTTGVGIALGPIVGGLPLSRLRRSSHPMLDMRFFRNRRFSTAVSSIGLATFGLFGALFVLT